MRKWTIDGAFPRQQSAASPTDGPRKSGSIPKPYISKLQLEEKLNEFKAENELLGRLLQDVQAERRALEGRLAESHVAAQKLEHLLEVSNSEINSLHHRLQLQEQQVAERDKQLARAHALQKELEDLVLSLNEKCSSQQAGKVELQQQRFVSKLRDEEKGQQRGSSPSRSLVHKAMSPQGRQYRQLPASSPQDKTPRPHSGTSPHGRVQLELLAEQHRAKVEQLERQAGEQVALLEEQHRQSNVAMRQQMQQLISEIKHAAETEVQRGMQVLERQAQDQLRILEQLDKRLGLLEAQSRRIKEAGPSHQSTGRQSQEGSGAAKRYIAAIKEAEEQVTQLRAQVSSLTLEKQQLEGTLALSQLTEGAHRQQAIDTATHMLRCREEMIKYVEEVHSLLGANAALQRDKLALGEQIAAAEEAIKALRVEMANLSNQLIEAKAENAEWALGARRSSKQGSEQPQHQLASNPTSEAVEIALAGLNHLKTIMKDATAESQYLECQARSLLASARNEQLAAQRALLMQVRRMQALEAMRLSDLQELHSMEKLCGRRDASS